jgi:hypothetical protein
MGQCAQDCRDVTFRFWVTRIEGEPPLVSLYGR